jgi:hypothetical protein
MKIACSSASFGARIRREELTQLEWLDLCANELEVDGVVFDVEHFPRTDDEYLAQLKKLCVDLGLTVAAVAAGDVFDNGGEARLSLALALGAPLVLGHAPPATAAAGDWGAFTARVKARAQDAKRANVTLALASRSGTLCPTAADLRRLAKDVDSTWLRFAIVASASSGLEAARSLLANCAIALAPIENVERFGAPGDPAAAGVVAALARFRGFVVMDYVDGNAAPEAYHRAIERFAAFRANALVASAL